MNDHRCWGTVETDDMVEWPQGTGKMIRKRVDCPNVATRYLAFHESGIVEHLCESCYTRDLAYPGTYRATEADYRAYQALREEA